MPSLGTSREPIVSPAVFANLNFVEPLDWRQFMIAIKKLADNFNYGTDHSPFLGSGVEFVQSRKYQFGDPVRSIDWRVTARTGKYFVKQFETPKQMPVYLLLDTSASMIVSSQRKCKLEIGLHIAGGLALACLDRVSPVGLVATGDDLIQFEPSLSKAQILQWIHRLRRFRIDQQTVLSRRLTELNARLSSRALIIVLSDLHEPAAIDAMKLTSQRHDCVAIQLRDPAEDNLRGTGLYRAREPETGREFVTHGRAQLVDQAALATVLKRAGIDHIVIDTSNPFAHRLRWFFKSRGVFGRTAR